MGVVRVVLALIVVVVQSSSFDEICEALLAERNTTTTSTSAVSTTSTTTTTTTTTTAYEQMMIAQFKGEFKAKIKADGKLLVKDLMSWLITRLVGVFFGLTICIPLVILMTLKCSARCRVCTAKLYSKVQFRGHVCVLMSVFLLDAGLSVLLSFNILNSVNVTIKEVRDYYLKGLTRNMLQDILGEVSDFSVGTFTTQRKMQLNATVCNPTDSPFIMHSMTANGFLEGTTILEATLPRKVRIDPVSLGQLVLDYHVLPSLGSLVAPIVGLGITTVLSGFSPEEVVMISVAINTDCKVQESRATVGLRINAPLLVSKLPTSFLTLNAEARQRAIEAEFGEPYMLQYHLYNALLGGLEYHRFFEWDSLELGGPLMTWVYTILLCASAMFSMSTAGIVLLLSQCRKCRCRRRPLELQPLDARDTPLGGLDSVVGRSLDEVQIDLGDIAAEATKPKPHMTKSLSKKPGQLVQS